MNEKSSQNLKVREALVFFSLLKFSIFPPFFQYQYQYQYQNSQKFQYQYQNQNFGNAYFNINIKINILKLQFSISKSISIWPKFWLFKIFQNFVPCLRDGQVILSHHKSFWMPIKDIGQCSAKLWRDLFFCHCSNLQIVTEIGMLHCSKVLPEGPRVYCEGFMPHPTNWIGS